MSHIDTLNCPECGGDSGVSPSHSRACDACGERCCPQRVTDGRQLCRYCRDLADAIAADELAADATDGCEDSDDEVAS